LGKLLITGGDPGGVGYEIVLKSLPYLEEKGILEKTVLIGNSNAFSFYAQKLNLPYDFSRVEMISVGPEGFIPDMGIDSAANGQIALDSINRAMDLIKQGVSSTLLTGPISKRAVVMSGQKGFRGHTDYLAESFNVKDYTMVLANPGFAVGLVTIHVPLSKVPSLVSNFSVETAVRNMHHLAKRSGEPDAPLWVCGLNPHAGEEGELGTEEQEIIVPALEGLAREGIPVKGPFPADALFKKALTDQGRYFVAMYHDQGLIPVKMLGKNKTVNITLGLPFFRISVEHGTAYDITGMNIADNLSFLTAVDIVCQSTGI
jgi:4-hydroxythreonine-4-phosphate dehydrogenase